MSYKRFGWDDEVADQFNGLELYRPFKRGAEPHPMDNLNVATAMTAAGTYDWKLDGRPPLVPEKLFMAVERFQADQGLKVDGVMNPGGPTQARLNEVLPARMERPFIRSPRYASLSQGPAQGKLGTASREQDAGLPTSISTDPNSEGDEPPTERTTPLLLRAARPDLLPWIQTSVPEAQDHRAKAGGLELSGTGRIPGSATSPRPFDLSRPPGFGEIDPDAMYAALGYAADGPTRRQVATRTFLDPIRAQLSRRAGLAALHESRRVAPLMAGRALSNDEMDAIRHTVWNILMVNGGLSAHDAQAFGDAYERDFANRNSDGERLADLFNNHVGRQLALDPRNRGRHATAIAVEALLQGRLQIGGIRLPRRGPSEP